MQPYFRIRILAADLCYLCIKNHSKSMTKRNTIYKIHKRTLLLIAGIVWFTAGIKVLAIGLNAWIAVSEINFSTKFLFALLTFCIFLFGIFKPMHNKHFLRICKLEEYNHPFAFFDIKGWCIMAFMMTLGVSIRQFNLLPNSFIATFYTGLSLALSITGVLFIIKWVKFKE